MTRATPVPDLRLGAAHPQLSFARKALVVGLVGSGIALVAAFLDPLQAVRSYLIGFLFWLGIALGSMGILSLHHVAGGRWSAMIRRPLEAAVRTIPLMAVLSSGAARGAGLVRMGRPRSCRP